MVFNVFGSIITIFGGYTMNPFNWRREHQVALVLGAIIGAVLLIVVGFMYRGANYGTLSSGLFWSASTFRWGVLGILIGGSLVYVRQLLHSK